MEGLYHASIARSPTKGPFRSKPEGFEVSDRVRFAPRSGRQSGHAGWSRSCHQPTSEPAVPLLAGSARGPNRLGHPPPSVIRVKTRHARSDRGRARAEVLLVDVPMMTDEECHQAGNAILRRQELAAGPGSKGVNSKFASKRNQGPATLQRDRRENEAFKQAWARRHEQHCLAAIEMLDH